MKKAQIKKSFKHRQAITIKPKKRGSNESVKRNKIRTARES